MTGSVTLACFEVLRAESVPTNACKLTIADHCRQPEEATWEGQVLSSLSVALSSPKKRVLTQNSSLNPMG
jgi:hypothetical protein